MLAIWRVVKFVGLTAGGGNPKSRWGTVRRFMASMTAKEMGQDRVKLV